METTLLKSFCITVDSYLSNIKCQKGRYLTGNAAWEPGSGGKKIKR